MEKTKASSNSPIGVFDSGLGGLTVLKSLKKIFPNESFIYFGDTAHVPYGTKSIDNVIKYSQNILNFFLLHKVKAVVIACNTASAVAYNTLKKQYSLPLFDVVSSSVEFTIKQTKTQNIGVIGTTSTINSKAYSKQFSKHDKSFSIFEIACPLFVSIIEEGWADTKIAKQIAKKYLKIFKDKNIDNLILGCTHYPIMENTIQSVLQKNINMILSGDTVGQKLLNYLTKNKMMNSSTSKKYINYYVSDFPQKFNELGGRFFGETLKNVNYLSFD